MQDTVRHAVLVVLLNQLGNDIENKNGAAAVATIELIGQVAGTAYKHWLMDQLITAGLQRLAQQARR